MLRRIQMQVACEAFADVGCVPMQQRQQARPGRERQKAFERFEHGDQAHAPGALSIGVRFFHETEAALLP
jgi:hypothetical protein